jgi:hypothetical protein
MIRLFFIIILSAKLFSLDITDINIMRDSNVLIAFPLENEAHKIPKSIEPSQLMNITYLKLNGQYLSRIPSWLPKMTKIVRLELENTHIDLIDLSAIKTLKELNSLNLSNNPKLFKKGGNLSKFLSNFKISELYLSNTGGDENNYTNLGENISLIKLDLSNNLITNINTLHLEKLCSLKELKLENNNISKTVDTAYFPKCSLVYLNLNGNNISLFKFSDDFTALRELHIGKNRSYLRFDEEFNDTYILKRLIKGSFNKDTELPITIIKRLGIKSKWIIPTNEICQKNGGKVINGICVANWRYANKICSVMKKRLPKIEEFKKLVTNCGGILNKGTRGREDNKKNISYQSCYKSKSFTSDIYWSSTPFLFTDKYKAWGINFMFGKIFYYHKSSKYIVKCIEK